MNEKVEKALAILVAAGTLATAILNVLKK